MNNYGNRRVSKALRNAIAALLAACIGFGLSNSSRANVDSEPFHDLRTITNADFLEGQKIGIGLSPSTNYAAYERVVASSDIGVDDLLAAYGRATPAGQIYVAAVILNKEPRRGEFLLDELGNRQILISTLYACTVWPIPVEIVARVVLEHGGVPPNDWRKPSILLESGVFTKTP